MNASNGDSTIDIVLELLLLLLFILLFFLQLHYKGAGADGITAELLKGAEKPISKALHKVITNVWSTGRVPAEWKEGLYLTSAADLNSLVLLPGGLLWMPY